MKRAHRQADLLGAHGTFAFLSLLGVGTRSCVLIWPMSRSGVYHMQKVITHSTPRFPSTLVIMGAHAKTPLLVRRVLEERGMDISSLMTHVEHNHK